MLSDTQLCRAITVAEAMITAQNEKNQNRPSSLQRM